MKARELAEILLAHPDYPVEMELPETIDDIERVEVDTFDEAVGPVFLLIPEGDR